MLVLRWLKDHPPVVAVFAIAAWSVFLAGLLVTLFARVETAYYETHSYFVDPASHSFYGAGLYQRLPAEGRAALAWHEWLHNTRQPLHTSLRLLIAPESFRSPIGHLWITAPILASFFFVLAWTVRRRTLSLLYALAAAVLFAALPRLHDPFWGLGAYWLDAPAALLAGAAMFCLFNVRANRHEQRWFFAFALFAAAATLHGYSAAVHVFVLCAPLLLWRLWARVRRNGDLARSVLLPLAIVGLTLGVLAGPFLVRHFDADVPRDAATGYALGQPLAVAAKANADALFKLFFRDKPLIGILLAGMLALQLWALWFSRREARVDGIRILGWLVASVWTLSSIYLFQTFGLRVVGADPVVLYAVPGIFMAFVSPAPLRPSEATRRPGIFYCITPGTALLVLALSGVILFRVHAQELAQARTQKPENVARKAFDVALADQLVRHGGAAPTWSAMFDEYAIVPALEAFYRHGTLPASRGGVLSTLSLHESCYKANLPGLAPEDVARRVYEHLGSHVKVAVVSDDPAQAGRAKFSNLFTKTVARHVAETIAGDPRWEKVFTLDSPQHGSLAGYRNLALNAGVTPPAGEDEAEGDDDRP